MLSVDEAARRVRARLSALPAERVPLAEADGRVLAAPIVADRALPPWDSSAMDGFAVRAADLPGTLPVAGTIAAGAPPTAALAPGSALRIMTGAPLPAGADAVVIREEVDDQGARAGFARAPRPGDHVRRAGEDVAPGRAVLAAGGALGPGELGLCAALGRAAVNVTRRPRVAILGTGDELCDVGDAPGPGQIVNSNAYALAAQVREAGGVPVPLGIARDDRDDVLARLRAGLAAGADVLVSTGGVSVGDYDVVKDALAALGVELDFWKVAMKPGKPLAFGHLPGGPPVFGLPGNPASSMVVFELFVRPALRALLGAAVLERPRAPVVLERAYRKEPGRAHYLRAALTRRGGELFAALTAHQGSHMLSSMVGVDALVELARERGDVEAGGGAPALLLRAV